MITLEQAKALKPGDVLYHIETKNADGTPQRWRVNGQPKTWKTMPHKVRVPVKNGLRNHDYITETNLALVSLSTEEDFHATSGDFVSYLTNTLIPDLKTSGLFATAEDFERAVRWIGHWKTLALKKEGC